MKLQIYQVTNRYDFDNFIVKYNKPGISGHKILAFSSESALLIAKKHGIATPFNRPVKKRNVKFYSQNIKKYIRRHKSSIWFEGTKGQLLAIHSIYKTRKG